MKYAFFLGCNTPARVEQYERSSRAVLKTMNVELFDFREFTCCGYPLRNIDRKAFLLAAAGNMAIAEREGLDMLILCKCGFGTFKEAQHYLENHNDLLVEINRSLAPNGLRYEGRVQIKHLLSVLYHDVGLDSLKKKIALTFKDLKIATHNGCHALRPSKITQFDDPVAPVIFDSLVKITGATSVDWTNKLECCGAPLMGVNDELSMNLTRKKLESGKNAGAHFMCTACPFCQIQFDTVQSMMASNDSGNGCLPSVLYPQLLGISLGIDAETLGINKNTLNIDKLTSYLVEE